MAANCVTNLQKKLADYIAALDKFNIPDSNLEMLLHKWLNLPENAELFRLGKLPFPSDEWLQEHLYAPASIVSEPKILELYDRHFAQPIVTSNIESANNIVRAVSKIISSDSVKILPTKDGKYLVVITRPQLSSDSILYQRTRKSEVLSKLQALKAVMLQTEGAKQAVANRIALYKALLPKSMQLGKTYRIAFYDDRYADTEEVKLEKVEEAIKLIKAKYTNLLEYVASKRQSDGGIAVYYKFKTEEKLIKEVSAKVVSYLDDYSDTAILEEYNNLVASDDVNTLDYLNYLLTPKKELEYTQQILSKVAISQKYLTHVIQYCKDLEDTSENNLFIKTIINWIKKGNTFTLMQMPFIRDYFIKARKLKIDVQQFKSATSLIKAVLIKEMHDSTDPAHPASKEDILIMYPFFTFEQEVTHSTGKSIQIYSVEDSPNGRQNVSQFIADTSPKNDAGKPIMSSPWCITTYNYDVNTKKATPTESAGHYWHVYTATPKKIAIMDGMPFAFYASDIPSGEWWSMYDSPYTDLTEVPDAYNEIILKRKERSLKKYIDVAGTYLAMDNATKEISRMSLNHSLNVIYDFSFFEDIANLLGRSVEIDELILYDVNTPLNRIIITHLGSDASLRFSDSKFDLTYKNRDVHIKSTDSIRHTSFTIYIDDVPYNIVDGEPNVDFLPQINFDGIIPQVYSYNMRLIELLLAITKIRNKWTNEKKLEDDLRTIHLKYAESITPLIQHLLSIWAGLIEFKNSKYINLNILQIIDNNSLPVQITNEIAKKITEQLELILHIVEAIQEAQKKFKQEVLQAVKNNLKTSDLQEKLNIEPFNWDDYEILEKTDGPEISIYLEDLEDEIIEDAGYETNLLEISLYDLEEVGILSEFDVEEVSHEEIEDVITLHNSQSLAESYNELVKKPVQKELSEKLRKILKKFHFEIIDDALMDTFGEDVLGAADLLLKVIYLANGEKLNAITEPEEFAHAFIALMGNRYRKPSTRDRFPENALYSELRDLVEQTSIYQEVLEKYKDSYKYENGNINYAALKEEALGQALATVLLERYEARTKSDASFAEKLKQWFNSVINWFKQLFNKQVKITNNDNQSITVSADEALRIELNKIAESILDGSYNRKYLTKLNKRRQKPLDVASSIRYDIKHNNGRILELMKVINSLGGDITGSLSVRDLGTLYRKAVDTLHDIDVEVPIDVHELQRKFPSILRNQFYPREQQVWNSEDLERVIRDTEFFKLLESLFSQPIHFIGAFTSGNDVITNVMLCDNPSLVERFKNMTGNFNSRLEQFTEEERALIYLVDLFFINGKSSTYHNDEFGITFTDYTTSFRSKMKMGRAKDIYDYQNFKPKHRTLYRGTSLSNTVLYSKAGARKNQDKNQLEINFEENTAATNTGIQQNQAPAASYEHVLQPSVKSYSGNITPSENTIFVFGSNPEGRHGAGAAKVARDKFGAQYGVGEGLTGNAYALPTKDLRVKENKGLRSIPKETIIESIKTLYKVATENPGKQFKVAFRNKLDETTLNGYTGEEMIDMFIEAGPIPENIFFSEEWVSTGKFNGVEITNNSTKSQVSNVTTHTDPQGSTTNVTSFEEKSLITEKPKAADNPDVENREKTENEVFFELQSELAKQLNAIYGIDAVFTGAEYGQIVHDIIYKISDIITEVERNPEAALRYNSNIQDTSVLKNADRKNIFALLGFDNILNFIASEYFHPANNTAIDGRKAIKQAKIVRDNIKAFVKSGMSLFAQLELFSLPSVDNLELVDTESDSTDPNVNEADNSAEFLQETVGDSQEAWQRESRTEVAYDRASILVKQALTQCYKLNPDGTPITDKWGVKQRMDGREALQAIIKWTQGALTLSSMVKKLEAHAAKEKWLQPIIDRLKDSSGKETAFQSQFFGVVSKYFQLYSIGKNTGKAGKKNYTVFEVNTHPALTEAKRDISGQYNAGVHPLFDSNGNVNSTSFELLKTISETLHKMLYSEDNAQQIAELLSDASMLLGYPVSVEAIQEILNASTFKQMTANSLLFIVKGIEDNKDKKTWQPFSAEIEDNGIINNIGKFIEPITSRLEDVANTSFYDSGNMYQSYVIPSYLTKLILKMSLSTEEEYTEFIEKEYGKFAQFKDNKSQWRNSWLQLLQDIPDARHLFTHKVQLNFDGNKYMVSRGGARSMSDADLTLSIIAEYFREEGANSTKRLAPAWFRVPLMSNKPSSEFIKFYSYRGPDYKNRVLNGCLHLFRQELSRMQTVKKRLEIFEKGSPELIQSFDGERGLKFCFFDFLNNVDNSKFKELVEKYTTNTITEQEKGELSDLGKTLIQKGIEEEWQKQLTEWQNNGVVEAAGNIQNISKDNVEKALENFFWNDFLASNNILNLTITDLAYYKNTEDVQKRLAQLHAPGIRANIETTDFEGKKVSDGYTRTIYLKDLEIDGKTLKSNIIENVKAVFNRKLETLKGTPLYDAAKAAYESIIESFEKGINVTDAQGYACPSSYRKKALLFGKWNTQAEEIYQKILSGEYTYTDIQTIFQPLKPFVYTQIEKDSGVDNVQFPTLKMGVQNKNSEYLLIMAAAITQNEDTGMPNYLRAIYNVMEESHKDSVKGIDTVQFESTVKTGLTGVIDISEAATTEEAEELLRDAIYSNRDTNEYDKTFVQELPFEDYCIQQEVPAHFRDHEQLQGSQIRMITVSDLNPNETYMVEGREVSAEEFRKEYEQTVAANILESINLLIEEFNLTPDATIKDRNIALAKVLQKEILSSPRYGIDLLMSCLLDENGKFMLPLGDPIQSKRIEQLINSIVKNRINKLKIAGGPIVQVSNFGTSRQLNIRFKGKNGEILKTLNDYISEGKTEQEWVEYIKENLVGIAYYEAFVPVYASEIFEDFMDALGNIDIEAVEAVNPDLLKMIGYRIPSEDKYSMAPIKVVGFMPKEAGDGIMLPYEITLITGSDYDIDKFYLMRKDMPLHKRGDKEIRKDLIDKFGKERKDDINIFLDMLSNPIQKPVAKSNYPDLWKEYIKIAYKAEPPTEGRLYRNNKIIDMTWEVLTHSDTADKILNPGGFEEQKLVGYLVQAARITGKSIEELEKLSTSQLKKICQTDKNIAFIGTHLQFYKQNAAASSILAIFAVAKVAHACLESNGFNVDLMKVCEIDLPYAIMGLTLYDNVELDPQKDIEGTFIGKTLGSLVASAADAVKDPVLNLMNINSDTVNILNTLIRIGLPFRKAAKLLSTKVVSDLLTKYNTEKLKGFTTFNTILNNSIQEIVQNLNIKVSDVNLEDLTEEEVNNAILKNDNKIDYKILLALKRVGLINEAMSGLNFATRFNSISSAVGPLIIDNLKIEHTLAKHFGEFPGIFVHGHDAGFTDVFNLHPILEKFADSVDVARKLFGNHMPTYSYLFGHILECLKGYTLLDSLFRDRKLFSQFNDFYQSYLLVANSVVSGDASVLKYYIEDFPKKFAKHKTTYTGNPFIDAIRFDVDSESGNPVLKINTTGLDAEAKSKLTSGWLDLYKSGNEGKKLAFDLFQYCFYKGGIGFNPQTFMTLLPIQVKMQLKGYKETFEQLPTISASHLLDCFIRNNWHNDKVVPYRKFEKPLSLHDGGFTDFYEADALKLQNVLAFKTEINGKELFFIQTYFSLSNLIAIYKMATPLGNGGEFVEIPNIPTMEGKEQQLTTTNREGNSLIEELEYEEVPVDTSTMTEQQAREMADDIFGKTSTTDAITQKKQLIVKKLKEKGVEVDEAKAKDTAKKTC